MGWDSDDEQSSHSSDEEDQSANVITYLLIAIDCDASMFEKDPNNDECLFKSTLRTCYEILDDQLLKGGRRGFHPIAIAVVTEDIDDMMVCDFKENLPDNVKKCYELTELSDEELKKKYKRDDTIQLSNFFRNCKLKFNVCSQDSIKNIAFVTNQSNPIGDDDDDKRLCVNHAKTFKDFNIYLELLTFNADFDYYLFFKEVLDTANSKFHYRYFQDMISLKEKLQSLLRYRGTRAVFYPFRKHMNFFDVVEKNYIKQHKFVNNVTVTKDTHKELKEIKQGGEYKNSYSITYADRSNEISLTIDERNALMFDEIPVGYSLLGTYKKQMIDTGLHSSDPKFIQKTERQNSPHFDIFWQYCVDKESKLICMRKYKKDGPTKLVQLTPKIVNNVRSFLVLGIPYFDDIKYQDLHNPLHPEKSTNDTNITKAAEDLVESLDFTYHPMKIHDTVNSRKWEYVRAQLLEEKSREVPDILDYKAVEKDVTEIVERFQELTRVTGIKRKAPAKGRANKKK